MDSLDNRIKVLQDKLSGLATAGFFNTFPVVDSPLFLWED